MKVAIITINDNNNYGNRLQNYALQKYLFSKLKIEKVDTIWYDPQYTYISSINIFSWKTWIKYFINWKNQRTYLKKEYLKDNIRMYNISKFTKKISTRLDFKIKDNLSREYDYFITGSDQVWNPNFWSKRYNHASIRFLKFVPKEKRIAYAASIAIPEIPKDKEQFFKDSLNEMKTISMREKAGAELVKKLTGRDVSVLVDPTILLSKEEWQKIELKPEWYSGEKYILTYFLGNPSPVIEKIAKKNNWKIYNLMDKSNLDLYASRVEEFVYLIEHAELVATDSFHACVFSILMNTPFLVVNRKEKGMADMTSRIDTLLELFGYQNRYIVNGECDLSDDEILHMDFSNVKAIQEREIARSTAYMKKALNIN
ncbi:MAG: polysaccharide pyruvyl transferase family protein [Megamonas funiformis]|uniref:polysaccharide pyruvyl transferase family protein n=1 Tax=Megamonas funiformis TaxID=437897 RepID=UPI001EBDC9FF|nr:polysaccharide pyruvyl transferase family protein [Megamonas funiformis]MBS7212309.1 polysaccharide pyruvyl transferase family protein [Megamonas funiformis]